MMATFLLFALTLTTTDDVRPITLGIYQYIGTYTADWSTVMATAVLASLPAIVLLLAAQRFIAAGATGGCAPCGAHAEAEVSERVTPGPAPTPKVSIKGRRGIRIRRPRRTAGMVPSSMARSTVRASTSVRARYSCGQPRTTSWAPGKRSGVAKAGRASQTVTR